MHQNSIDQNEIQFIEMKFVKIRSQWITIFYGSNVVIAVLHGGVCKEDTLISGANINQLDQGHIYFYLNFCA